MSVFSIKSQVIQRRDASPPLLTNPGQSKGRVREAMGVEQTGAAIMDTTSSMKLISVPSNARIHKLEYAKETTGTSTFDISVYYPTRLPQGAENSVAKSLEGTQIASSSAFLGAISGVDGNVGWTDGFGAANVVPTLQDYSKQLWELLGLANDPGCDLDLGFTFVLATVEQGYCGLRAVYVD